MVEEKEPRITTGISGLDEMLEGGLLPGHIVVLAGPPGSGKTIATLQFIWANLNQGRSCLFISASEDPKTIMMHSSKFGWDFEPYIRSGKLKMINVKLVDVEHGLSSDAFEQLPRILRNSGAQIVGIDSITEFGDLCSSELERRGRLLYLRSLLKSLGVTAILTAELAPNERSTKYGMEEYIADGFILQTRFQSEDMSQVLHVIQIQKMRWIKHSREIRAYNITNKGLEIYSPLYTVLASIGKKPIS